MCLALIPEPGIVKNCSATPSLWADKSPKSFLTSSDLRRSPGSSVFISGQNIVIFGRVLDERCIPLAAAKVNIWQQHPHQNISNDKDPSYLTGSITTDNLGNFSFYTIMPLKEKNIEQSIHFHISHPDVLDFETQMFFSKNIGDADLLKDLSEQEKASLTAICANCEDQEVIDKYYFQIIVPGVGHYKEY